MIVKGILAHGIHKIRGLKFEYEDYKNDGQKDIASHIEWTIHDITVLIAEILDVSAYTITKLVDSLINTSLDKDDNLAMVWRVSVSDRLPINIKYEYEV